MRGKLAERAWDEPDESTRERAERLREELKCRRVMRQTAKWCCTWLSGAALVVAAIAAYAQVADAAAVTAGISLMMAGAGILL